MKSGAARSGKRGVDGLTPVAMPVSDLAARMAAWNPRKISGDDLVALRASLRRFGAVQSIVVNRRSGNIVGGHQRVHAAQLEGIASLPVVWVDLDPTGERQLNLALNRIHGEFDPEKLQALLREMDLEGADMALTGFTRDELNEYLTASANELREAGLTDPDAIPEPPDKPVTRRGDLIELGNHRLLCGDSSKPEDLERLLGGELVQLVNTDPPYNVRVEPRSNNAIAASIAATGRGNRKGNVPSAQLDKMHHQGLDLARHPGKAKPNGKMRAKDRALENDFLPAAEFEVKLLEWFTAIGAALEPGRSFYVWGGYANLLNYPAAFVAAKLFMAQTVIWHKQWPVLTRKDFMGDHEWAFYGWKEGAAHFFNPEIKNATDVWVVKKVTPQAMVHLTEKPVELAERAMTYSSRAGDRVLDLFGGSGSTLIAAERLGRKALLVEIDPAYCDVIVTRWEQFTGKKAKPPQLRSSARNGK